MKTLGNLQKSMDTDISHVVGCVHVHTMFCQVFTWWCNDHHLGVSFGSPLALLLGILGCLLELL